MRILEGREFELAKGYMDFCEEEAKRSLCLRSKCGSIIVSSKLSNLIIGYGFNGPPGNIQLDKCFKDNLPRDFKSNRDCCIHAEQRAIMDASKKYPDLLKDSTIYFLRLDMNNQRLFAGRPFCTICSKMALDEKLKSFVLWHTEGITLYNTQEYNELSFAFRE